jgi:hypothetical protein
VGNAKHLYSQHQLPILQNRMYDTEAEAKNCPKGDVYLVEDQETGLVFNLAFRPELMVYDSHYQNEQGASPLFREHLNSVADIVERHLGATDLVEVGCGKGLFLELLLARGIIFATLKVSSWNAGRSGNRYQPSQAEKVFTSDGA